jgi:cyclophilin family peptidyl-prolyl cis-trans isomerase
MEEKSASGAQGQSQIDDEIEELHKNVESMVDKLVAAGLKVHRAGLSDDPTVNSALVNIAGFYVAGDPNGDGGDQYEKALPLIKTMLDAGLGATSKELWLWGGVSAFNLNDYNLAERYFSEAAKAGMLGSNPPGKGNTDPLNRVWQLGKTQRDALAPTKRAWQKEQTIRAQEAQADNLPRVKFHTTRGDVTIELFENEAPVAVASFISLVKQGFYDGVVFHRVLPAFMAQGGDPTGTGSGGPGYSIRCECHGPNTRKHFRGSMSMAHAGRDTGGSQFFLTFVPTSYLNGRHTVFGRVIEGMEVASALKRRDPQGQGPMPDPDKIIKAHLLRDRGHEYPFEKLSGK